MATRHIDQCVCGHSAEAHEHYRRGTDCSLCAARDCLTYRRAVTPRRIWLPRIFPIHSWAPNPAR
jgi:hypothetical protein